MALLHPAAREPLTKPIPALVRRIRAIAPLHLASLVFFVAFAGQAVRNLVDWAGFAVVVLALFAVTLIRLGPVAGAGSLLRSVPRSLLLFVALSAASIAWSQYPTASVLGVAIQVVTALTGVLLASALGWSSLLEALWRAVTWICGLSLGFELVVSLVIGHPVLPPVLPADGQPASYYWSADQLLVGGPIQGIVGNRNLLAFVALLGLIVAGLRMFEHARGRLNALVWTAVFLLCIGLTRSATVVLAVVALLAVVAVLLAVRYLPWRLRRLLYPGGAALLLALVSYAVIHSATIFSLVGRDDDMSGRAEIWSKVLHLAAEHPVLGWGWVSYWVPWVEPFKGLVVIDHTPYFQAHNALLDILMQLGAVGAIAAIAVAGWASSRAWRIAVAPVDALGRPAAYRARTLAPVLLLGALLIQSLTESRLLIEGNWLLLVVLCVLVKRDSPPSGSTRLTQRPPREAREQKAERVPLSPL
ncbi:O-antigen ligase family protein [Microbacteriaceae bacterium VKM Ac-2854]|nr:O-antigen ligase family protein [Microbacteriaceae bacterium VKM Ac-2854]